MHLERLLHSQGFGTRKSCRQMVRKGLVKVAGELIEDPFYDVPLDPAAEPLKYEVDGEAWEYHTKAYIVFNKPSGYECSHAPLHNPSIYEILPYQLSERGVQSVGRLDGDTTGLLLMSDDGQFIHKLTSPKKKVPKVYDVTTKHPMDEEQLAALLEGVQLHDENAPIAVADASLVSENLLRMTITEGKYHQVKRMVAAAGNRVEFLRRISIGSFALPDDLEEGGWRWLTADELERLFV